MSLDKAFQRGLEAGRASYPEAPSCAPYSSPAHQEAWLNGALAAGAEMFLEDFAHDPDPI